MEEGEIGGVLAFGVEGGGDEGTSETVTE